MKSSLKLLYVNLQLRTPKNWSYITSPAWQKKLELWLIVLLLVCSLRSYLFRFSSRIGFVTSTNSNWIGKKSKGYTSDNQPTSEYDFSSVLSSRSLAVAEVSLWSNWITRESVESVRCYAYQWVLISSRSATRNVGFGLT